MNYRKLDPELIDAIDILKNNKNYSIFLLIDLETDITNKQEKELQDLNVNFFKADNKIYLFDVKIDIIDQLTDMPWIKHLTLSKRLDTQNFSLVV